MPAFGSVGSFGVYVLSLSASLFWGFQRTGTVDPKLVAEVLYQAQRHYSGVSGEAAAEADGASTTSSFSVEEAGLGAQNPTSDPVEGSQSCPTLECTEPICEVCVPCQECATCPSFRAQFVDILRERQVYIVGGFISAVSCFIAFCCRCCRSELEYGDEYRRVQQELSAAGVSARQARRRPLSLAA